MNNQLIAISSLFAMTACSTSFEEAEGQISQEPTVELTTNQAEVNFENADVSAMALPRIDADVEFDIEAGESNSGTVTNVLPEYPIVAMNVKRVENELHLRLFPDRDAYVKICTHGSTVDCFAGKTSSVDNMNASETLIELDPEGQPERFTIRFSDGINSYQEMGPYDIPSAENVWKEVESCKPELNLDYVDYQLHTTPNGDYVRLDMSSDTPSSAMVCGLDEADENICIWDDLKTGRREFTLPVSSRNVFPAVIRDEKGCSLHVTINP